MNRCNDFSLQGIIYFKTCYSNFPNNIQEDTIQKNAMYRNIKKPYKSANNEERLLRFLRFSDAMMCDQVQLYSNVRNRSLKCVVLRAALRLYCNYKITVEITDIIRKQCGCSYSHVYVALQLQSRYIGGAVVPTTPKLHTKSNSSSCDYSFTHTTLTKPSTCAVIATTENATE